MAETEAITLEMLEAAYRQGVFPMGDPKTGEVGWYLPEPRAVFDLDDFHVPRRLAKTDRLPITRPPAGIAPRSPAPKPAGAGRRRTALLAAGLALAAAGLAYYAHSGRALHYEAHGLEAARGMGKIETWKPNSSHRKPPFGVRAAATRKTATTSPSAARCAISTGCRTVAGSC